MSTAKRSLKQSVGTPYDEMTVEEQEDTAVDWLMAVRKYGIEKANEMFPEG